MMQIGPTPARLSREDSAEPVAPQPTMAIREAVSFCWPSTPIPLKSSCREYLSSWSKEVISCTPTNHYDSCHVVCKTKRRLESAKLAVAERERANEAGFQARSTTFLCTGFIVLSNHQYAIGEPVCN